MKIQACESRTTLLLRRGTALVVATTMIFGFAAEPIHAKERLADEAARPGALGAALGGAAFAIISAMIRHDRDRNLEVIPRSVDFGIIRAGEQLDKTVILRNRGADGLRITHISVQGPSFTLLEIPQMPISLAGSSSVELKLRFAPASCGGSSGTIQIEHLRTTGSGCQEDKDCHHCHQSRVQTRKSRPISKIS